MTKVRMYRIICLKRSNFGVKTDETFISDWYNNSELVFWRPNRAGYTKWAHEAGLYSQEELHECAGSYGDWLLEPTWIEVEEE
jgi:hypothetical protein